MPICGTLSGLACGIILFISPMNRLNDVIAMF